MPQFAAQLEVALKEMKWRQTDLLREVPELSQGMLSQYINGSALPRLDKLEAICKVLPENLRLDLTTAYVFELIPPSLADLLEIRPAVQIGADSPAYGQAPKGSELREELRYLEREAISNPHLRQTLISMARLLRGEPLGDVSLHAAPPEPLPGEN